MKPAFTDISIDWGVCKGAQSPFRLPNLFAGHRMVVYAFLGMSLSFFLSLSHTHLSRFRHPLDQVLTRVRANSEREHTCSICIFSDSCHTLFGVAHFLCVCVCVCGCVCVCE